MAMAEGGLLLGQEQLQPTHYARNLPAKPVLRVSKIGRTLRTWGKSPYPITLGYRAFSMIKLYRSA